jgi:hypothetical protein
VGEEEHRGKGTRHARSIRRLAVLPAVIMAAVAFAVPARAEDEAPSPALQEAVHVDPSLATEVVVTSDADAMPVEPMTGSPDLGDPGTGAAPPETPERPANTPSSGWVLVESADRSSAPIPRAAVIPPQAKARVAVWTPAEETPARRALPAKNGRQYQPPGTQYQQLVGAAPRVKAASESLRSVATVTASGRTASINTGITPRNRVENCSDESNLEAPNCPGDAAEKFTSDCRWIPDCAGDESLTEAPQCDDSETQYQPGDEQYQSEVEDPDGESSDKDGIEPGENEPAPGSCDDDDADDASAVPVGGPSVEPPGGSDSGITQPAPTAPPELPSTTGPGVGPQSLTGPEPSAPPLGAAPVGESAAAETARPRGGSSEPRRPPTDVRHPAGRVLGVLSTKHDAQRHPDVRPQPKGSGPGERDAEARPTLSRPRVEVLASHERTSGGGATGGPGVWLLASAMLLFAVALLGLAYSGLAASLGKIPLGVLGSRLRSRGLSRSSAAGEKPTGIRYRD